MIKQFVAVAAIAVTGPVYAFTGADPDSLSARKVSLEEVTVSIDRSRLVKRTADGQMFFLSERARSLSNPFQALEEIPLLIPDVSTSTIKLADGTVPLILVDGDRVNTGIAPIAPADIESVEVITQVSARYLQEGYKAIVNIKLKKKRNPYIWFETATRHDIPLDHGFGVVYFEVGNPKVSLYGRSAAHYTYHDDTRSTTTRSNTTYSQNFDSRTRRNANDILGELLLKTRPSASDYAAVHVYASDGSSRTSGQGEGEYNDAVYLSDSYSREKSMLINGSAYWKHTFAPGRQLELRGVYSHNGNDYRTVSEQLFGTEPVTAGSDYRNQRNSVTFTADYSHDFSNGAWLGAGASTEADGVRLNNITIGQRLPHRILNQYVYTTFAHSLGAVRYMVSAGAEGIWMKTGNASGHYIRPRGSASAIWVVNSANSFQLSYTLTNDAPSVAQLNPYNISSDPLVVQCGNPGLKPQYMNYVDLSYTLNAGNLYLMPKVYYKVISDMIEEYGYTDRGVYYNTYHNSGHFSQWLSEIYGSYKVKAGRIYAAVGTFTNKFADQGAHTSVYTSAGYMLRVGKWMYYGSLYFNARDMDEYSIIRHYRPSRAELQVNYNITPDFYIGVSVQHFTGRYRTRTLTSDGTYHAAVSTVYTDRCVRPWVILRYTLRKNAKNKIDLDEVLSGSEPGITMRRK